MRKKNTIPEETEIITGTLFLVSTPIGNDDDITLRALKVLKSVDIVVCEEAKVGARTLHKYNLTQKMELLNEQNEEEKTDELMEFLLAGKNLALISDCGTPVFADPGLILVQRVLAKELNLVVVPGPTSIMTAIVRSGFRIEQFIYAGFLSRTREERTLQLKRLKDESKTIVIFETPYRLIPMLEAAKGVMPDRKVYIGCNLTMSFETHHYGTFSELYKKFKENKFKGEFVIVFEGASLQELQEEPKETKKIIINSQRSESSHDDDEDFRFNRIGKRLQGAYYEDEEFRSYATDKPKPSRYGPSKPSGGSGGGTRRPYSGDNRSSGGSGGGGFKKGPRDAFKGGPRKSVGFKSDERNFKPDDRGGYKSGERSNYKSDDRGGYKSDDRGGYKSDDRGPRKFGRDTGFKSSGGTFQKGKPAFKKKIGDDAPKKFGKPRGKQD